MALLKQDELNNLAIPYEQYFAEMGLSEEEIKRRVELAELLDDVFIYIFVIMKADLMANRQFDKSNYEDIAKRRFEDVLSELGIDTSTTYPWLATHVSETVDEIVEKTEQHENDAEAEKNWFLSVDRAMLIAENESNSVYEYKNFQDAVNQGKTMKRWNTMLDKRVRFSHEYLEGETIPIMGRFQVGNYEMYFPKDTSLGAGIEETARCRCWCSYI